MRFSQWVSQELPRATGYEIDLTHTVWIAALEQAALECDREADLQSLYASEAGTPGLRLIHGTAANTLMSVACRIRTLKEISK